MRTEVHVKVEDDCKLLPGVTGTATLVLDEGMTKKLTIPSTALVRSGEEIRVYYVDKITNDDPPRGTVKVAVVQLGLDDGKTVQIKSGLTGEELVIARGNGMVRQGETVIPVKVRPRKQE
jgi:multidrug efflux pump subunit AcrA (membrane-fusion protein)